MIEKQNDTTSSFGNDFYSWLFYKNKKIVEIILDSISKFLEIEYFYFY